MAKRSGKTLPLAAAPPREWGPHHIIMGPTAFASALAAVGLRAAAQPDEPSEARRRRPVLLVIADDLRPQFSYLGFRDVKTPNIDRLAAEGVTFSRAYYPVPGT